MEPFVKLYRKLQEYQTSAEKVTALRDYFDSVSELDKRWALALLSGRWTKKSANIASLRLWATELAMIPAWLFEESYRAAGDIEETIALIVQQEKESQSSSLSQWMDYTSQLADLSADEKKNRVTESWKSMDAQHRLLFNKIIAGTFKTPVTQNLIYEAISILHNVDLMTLVIRLSNNWELNSSTWKQLIFTETESENHSFSYPFMVPNLMKEAFEMSVSSHFIEWNYNGIRAQLVKRNNQCYLWSKKAELMTNLFPEIIGCAAELPDGTVLDGIIIPMIDGKIQPKSILKARLSRKTISPKLIKDLPVQFVAFDLLEFNNHDLRNNLLSDRKSMLESLLIKYKLSNIVISESFNVLSKAELQAKADNSRNIGANGVVLKSASSSYNADNTANDWIKLCPISLSVNAVLVYASSNEKGSSFQYNEFTFALFEDEKLVPIAKTSLGFTEEQLEFLNQFVRKNTLEKFGPVRSLVPIHVFELKFNSIQRSKRHKVGFQLINPEVSRAKEYLSIHEIDRIDVLKKMLRD